MGLLDHLGIQRAFVLGGCLGCSTATAFGAAYPEATLGLLLHWPWAECAGAITASYAP